MASCNSRQRPQARRSAPRSSVPRTGRPSRTGGYDRRAYAQRRDLGSAAPRVSTVKVGSLAQDTHRRRAQETYRAHMAKAIAVLAIVAVLAVAAVGVYLSPLFGIKQVTVSGVEHLTADEMTQLANVPSDTTLLRVDAGAIKQSIMRDAWVADVDVQRVFPDTLNLAVTERQIGATVQVTTQDGSSTETWALSTDGMWLCLVPEEGSEEAQTVSPKIIEDAANVFSIKDVGTGVSPEIGAYCTDESIVNALDIVTGLTTELKDQIVSVSAQSAESTRLTLESKVEIDFGVAEDIREKERICLQLLADNPGKVAYINVRVVDSPTWRAV